jgi:hypothetical protein
MLLSKWVESDQIALQTSDADLALVRKFAQNKAIGPEDVWTGRQHLCNDRYDRGGERFPLAYLERIAATAPGKSVMAGHDQRTLPLARYYDARVEKDAQGHHVTADYYVNRRTQRGQDLISDIETGILKHVSVTIKPGPRLCDLCGKAAVMTKLGMLPGCDHWPGREHDGKPITATYDEKHAHQVEMYEGSFVFCGQQYDAEAVPKALALMETPNLLLYRSLLAAETPIEEALQKLWQLGCRPAPQETLMFETLEKAQAEYELLQKAHAEREAEISRLKTIEPLSKDGEAYRGYLKGEILRLAGVVEKTATYEQLISHLGEAGADTLEPIRKELDAEVKQKLGPVSPQGHTNGPPPEGEQARKPLSTPFGRFGGF